MIVSEQFLAPDRLFDGHTVAERVAVAVTGDRISRVVPIADVPSGATVVRLDGCTLGPGLIDAHLHLAPWMVFGLIAAGITTVRDVGNDVDRVIPQLDALAHVPLPTVHWSGPLLESTKVNWPSLGRAHATTDEVRASVDELAARGFRSVTLYANATPELMAAAADQAHGHGMRVLGHLGATDLDGAVAGHVDELQHFAGCLAADLGATDWLAAAGRVAEAPVDHCPTLVVWQALARLGEPRLERDEAMRWVPASTRSAWASAYHASQPASERLRRLSQLLERMTSVSTLRDAGRRLLVGSDSPFPGLVPGASLQDEAGLLVESGMTPLEVMVGLTSGNADIAGLPDCGSIRDGAVADLVAFRGDPTRRIADITAVHAVWRAGQRVDVARLAEQAAAWFGSMPPSPMDDLAERRYVPATQASSTSTASGR
ncbi:MAG: amidohydrolase family protein [Actinobacteria bacterium]|nr:amidohydrolase family protein [Actinomycetota bacterium]